MNFLPSVIIDCWADGRIMAKDLMYQLGIDRDPLPHHVLGQTTHQKSPVHVSLSAEHPETMRFLLNFLPCLPLVLLLVRSSQLTRESSGLHNKHNVR